MLLKLDVKVPQQSTQTLIKLIPLSLMRADIGQVRGLVGVLTFMEIKGIFSEPLLYSFMLYSFTTLNKILEYKIVN